MAFVSSSEISTVNVSPHFWQRTLVPRRLSGTWYCVLHCGFGHTALTAMAFVLYCLASRVVRAVVGEPSPAGATTGGFACAAAAPARVKQTRKPEVCRREPGLAPSRNAERACSGPQYHVPPRLTRFELSAGPVGSSVGDFA
jgi:hypothetical protein